MNKRLLLLLPLALVLGACGSSGNHNAPTLPASSQAAPAASQKPRAATPMAPATTTAAASHDTSTPAPAGSSAPTAASSTTGMNAAARAARAKAAKDFTPSDKWVEGKNYERIEPQQPKVTNTDKIEVVEVFSFGCPACNAAHKVIDKMEASLPPYATMAFLPAGFRPDENWVLYQRAWYAAKALGVASKSYDAMFDATWKSGETATYDLSTGRPKPQSQWPTIDDIAKFYTRYGVSAKEFKAVADSFSVNTKIKRADELVKDYGVRGTPTIVIDGKYRFDFTSAGGASQAIELANYLVAREAAGQ